MTMTLVETIEVPSGGASSIEFTSIPQDADDLLVLLSVRNGGSGSLLWTSINGDTTGGNYSWRRLYGNGGSVGSNSATSQTFDYGIAHEYSTLTANTFQSTSIYFPNYAGSSAKSYSVDNVTENNATTADQQIIAGIWNQTAGITSLKFTNTNSSLVQYSTVSLYKITKA